MSDASAEGREPLAARHLSIGWWQLLGFLCLGVTLEAMHGLKLGFYLDVSNETRRLLWTLAHAHGVLFGLVHIALAVTLRSFALDTAALGLASRCLTAGGLLLPLGFLLGGLVVYGGDPGPGIALAPLGALLLLYAVFCFARSTGRPA